MLKEIPSRETGTKRDSSVGLNWPVTYGQEAPAFVAQRAWPPSLQELGDYPLVAAQFEGVSQFSSITIEVGRKQHRRAALQF
jgi:hypothetical protein